MQNGNIVAIQYIVYIVYIKPARYNLSKRYIQYESNSENNKISNWIKIQSRNFVIFKIGQTRERERGREEKHNNFDESSLI